MKQPKETITIRANKNFMDYVRSEENKNGISINAMMNIIFTKILEDNVNGNTEQKV